jgi:hypothetical protein
MRITTTAQIIFLTTTYWTATFTGFGQPAISNQPASQSVSLGANATFTVDAAGTLPFNYQWLFNGTNLMNDTNRSLTITNTQLTNAGDYSVALTDSSGSVTSRVAQLDVDPAFTKITTGSLVNEAGHFASCAWGDYDNDGFIDLFVSRIDGEPNSLYRNHGDGTFEQIAAGPVATDVNPGGCAWADFDNDGNLDLVVAGVAENTTQAVLYRNNGDGSFTRMPPKTLGGIVPSGAGNSEAPVWADYDNDGFVDLFVARYGTDWLFHNNGDGTFSKVINNVVGAITEDSYSASWADYNNDGLPDLFVTVHSDPPTNRLYLNLGGGAFARISSGNIATDSAHAFACAWGDYDNDGYPDLFVSNGGAFENNALYHNNGDGTFTKMTSDVVGRVVSDVGGSLGCAWGDYDNDGYLDLFVTNIGGQTNSLYHNNGDGSFSRVLTGSLANDVALSLSCAWGDYDNDGFLDLFVANGAHTLGTNFLYRNNGNSNNWIKFKLVGTVSNRAAIGAKVRVKATIRGRTFCQLREVSCGDGGDGNSLITHFGLGDATNVDVVRIEWPSGIVQTMTNIPSKRFLTIIEHQANAAGTIRFTGVERLTTGSVRLSASGNPGLRFVFEASTNLIYWTRIGIRTNLSGAVEFVDPVATNLQYRFYRVSAP